MHAGWQGKVQGLRFGNSVQKHMLQSGFQPHKYLLYKVTAVKIYQNIVSFSFYIVLERML